MKYLWIFAASYLAAFILAKVVIGLKIAKTVRYMKETMGNPNLDLYYSQMKGPTRQATIQMTLITGSFIGALGSLLGWILS
ncbi:hypothetical protein C4K35_4243 [Pseudomonas chlororaphis subsp. piscium]|uniref:hypothetical protein n=1 Tax=Pseudomonas chlororaphis TaxID=587753 RepID=UPI000F56C2B0|nr:hypothetical protein [Pseudomonas chlororaphis]AZC51818.1 hypothetical protein C4K35_4243 [Pseudomonas chlororaphis subsp. piscium]AZD85107.1 hypothetical protein C4K14_2283 [Pseudomonas chlororaphis subsp. aureofaciens]